MLRLVGSDSSRIASARGKSTTCIVTRSSALTVTTCSRVSSCAPPGSPLSAFVASALPLMSFSATVMTDGCDEAPCELGTISGSPAFEKPKHKSAYGAASITTRQGRMRIGPTTGRKEA